MPTDEQIVRHLAQAMGWRETPLSSWEESGADTFQVDDHGYVVHCQGRWNPLASIDTAFEVLEKWRMVAAERFYFISSPGPACPHFELRIDGRRITATAGSMLLPRAICIALYRVTGGAE